MTYFMNVSGGDSAESTSRASMEAFAVDAIANYYPGGMRHDRAVLSALLLIKTAEEDGRACSINGAFHMVVA